MAYAVTLFTPTETGYDRSSTIHSSLDEALTAARADLERARPASALRRLLALRDRRRPYFQVYETTPITTSDD